MEENIDNSITSSEAFENIYDPGKWKTIDKKFRALMIEKDAIRFNNFQFSKDKNSRNFNSSFYERMLPNGEKYDRKWLVYFRDLDKVYCFCCKLFCSSGISQIVDEGTSDWKNLSSKLKSHETSHDR